MPNYLAVFEAEGYAYPFLVEAQERGHATSKAKSFWQANDFGGYEQLKVESFRPNRQGIARLVSLNPKATMERTEQVHNVLLDMQQSLASRYEADKLLRQLCVVMMSGQSETITRDIAEIVRLHEQIHNDPSAD